MDEYLTKSLHTATFTVEDLRRALSVADGIEALLLLPMIGDAARLVQQIEALIEAKNSHNNATQQISRP
jgi:hypothetical protein